MDDGSQASEGRETFARDLLAWYDRHARDLPWRIGPKARRQGLRPDPYRVWLSEIMLQQTTVAAVKSYYANFLERWPTVSDLAAAPENEVLSAWAGLGYYARARNLHACAKAVVADHQGQFPGRAEGLRALPGVGAYTSAAIAAIAFDEPAAVVDGNVERVTSRYRAIETPLPKAKREIAEAVAGWVPADRPGDFAQAMMDLGATICTPRKPACVLCPVRSGCAAAALGRQADFPVKAPKKARPERRGAAFVAIRRRDGAVWLRKRPGTGMLAGMSEPFTTAWHAGGDGETGSGAAPFPAAWEPRGAVVHGFTHFGLTLEVWRATVDEDPPIAGRWAKNSSGEALPTLMRKVLAAAVD